MRTIKVAHSGMDSMSKENIGTKRNSMENKGVSNLSNIFEIHCLNRATVLLPKIKSAPTEISALKRKFQLSPNKLIQRAHFYTSPHGICILSNPLRRYDFLKRIQISLKRKHYALFISVLFVWHFYYTTKT